MVSSKNKKSRVFSVFSQISQASKKRMELFNFFVVKAIFLNSYRHGQRETDLLGTQDGGNPHNYFDRA